MKTCSECSDKKCLIKGKGYGKPCKEIERQLSDGGIYSRDWIRPLISGHKRDSGNRYREIPLSSLPNDKKDEISL